MQRLRRLARRRKRCRTSSSCRIVWKKRAPVHGDPDLHRRVLLLSSAPLMGGAPRLHALLACALGGSKGPSQPQNNNSFLYRAGGQKRSFAYPESASQIGALCCRISSEKIARGRFARRLAVVLGALQGAQRLCQSNLDYGIQERRRTNDGLFDYQPQLQVITSVGLLLKLCERYRANGCLARRSSLFERLGRRLK